jgi:hypothetical protein
VDRIVLRAYFRFIQEPGGFRLWWRRWQGSEEQLDDAHLLRVAGHFARRLKAWAKAAGVPVIFSGAGCSGASKAAGPTDLSRAARLPGAVARPKRKRQAG